MSNFKRGDRVAFHFDKSTVGTVTRADKSETRVLWADGIETPVDPLELIHAEKDRSISDQESAAAPTESPSKETIIIQSTDRAQCANCGHEMQQSSSDISDQAIVRLAELMAVHPVHMKNRRFHTINDLFRWCEEHELLPDEAPAAWAAFEATYGIQGVQKNG